MKVIGSSSEFVRHTVRDDKKPVDIDLLGTREEFKEFLDWCKGEFIVSFLNLKEHSAAIFIRNPQTDEKQIIEFTFEGEGVFAESNKLLVETGGFFGDNLSILGEQFGYVEQISLCAYYWQKMSHRFLKNSKHFEKTRQDILKIRKQCKYMFGIDFTMNADTYKEFYEQRVKETYQYNHPNLNQSKSTFFTDEVGYVYDHDDIHEAVKMLDKPAYKYYIEPGCEVKCSKELFVELPYIVKLYGVLEESYVLALERSVIPFNTVPEKAFKMALEKVCTSITSGWFREFAWENYDQVMNLYHDSYVKKFENALNDGKIKGFREDEKT